MLKPAYKRHEKTGFLQLRKQRRMSADQHFWFRSTNSTISLLPKSKVSNFCSCTDWFVSDQGGNPEDLFFRIMAHLKNIEYSKVNVI